MYIIFNVLFISCMLLLSSYVANGKINGIFFSLGIFSRAPLSDESLEQASKLTDSPLN